MVAKAAIAVITRGKGTCHYTNTHKSFMKYHRKVSESLIQLSASEKSEENNDPLVDTKHTPT